MVPDCPYHITHRGNRKKELFSSVSDYRWYLARLEEYATRFSMKIWGYCLMPNHVHLIAVGARQDSLAKAIGNAHRAFARKKNFRDNVTGHAWANRFASSAMDERHLWAAIRYIELNPVRACLVDDPTNYPWSSVHAHSTGVEDRLLDPARPFPGPIQDWREWLRIGLSEEEVNRIRLNTSTGRPSGSSEFVAELERRLSRRLQARRRGPKPGKRCVE